MSKPILLFSGGLDSTTLLWKLKPFVKCLLVDYDQRHKRELTSAMHLCDENKVEFKIANLVALNHLLASGSQSGREEVPEGHYAEASMKRTIVPNRNMIMLAIAVGWAVATESKDVYWAAHAGDHAIYPDCRPEFLAAMRGAIAEGNAWTPTLLHAPFIHKSKADIVKEGLELGVPYERTWSCYKGLDLACGKCGTCVERLEAFQLCGSTDPLKYEAQ